MGETTGELIARIRESWPTPDVLLLCKRMENLLSITLRLERALHDALKILEKKA